MAHLGLEVQTANEVRKNIHASNVTSLGRLPRPKGVGEEVWEEKILNMQSLIDQGLLYF